MARLLSQSKLKANTTTKYEHEALETIGDQCTGRHKASDLLLLRFTYNIVSKYKRIKGTITHECSMQDRMGKDHQTMIPNELTLNFLPSPQKTQLMNVIKIQS